MLKKLLYIVLGIILLPLGCCKEPCEDPTNPDCVNFDPCHDVQIPNANFKMRSSSPGFPDPVEDLMPEFCDTMYGAGAQFVADMDNALSYSWKIGADSRTFTGKSFKLGFNTYYQDTTNNLQDNGIFYKPLEIELTVRHPNVKCWQTQDTLSIQRKKLYFVKSVFNTGNLDYLGKYKGKFENDQLDRVLTLETFDMPVTGITKTRMLNVPDFDTFTSEIIGRSERVWTFKTLYYPLSHQQNKKWYEFLNGLIYFRIDREYSPDGRHYIELEYRIINQDETEIKTYKFKGRKLP